MVKKSFSAKIHELLDGYLARSLVLCLAIWTWNLDSAKGICTGSWDDSVCRTNCDTLTCGAVSNDMLPKTRRVRCRNTHGLLFLTESARTSLGTDPSPEGW